MTGFVYPAISKIPWGWDRTVKNAAANLIAGNMISDAYEYGESLQSVPNCKPAGGAREV
jgi:hypothetical protein